MEETTILSLDSSLWYVPDDPSAHPSIVFAAELGSGPLLARPSRSKPDEHCLPVTAHLGAPKEPSCTAITPSNGVGALVGKGVDGAFVGIGVDATGGGAVS